MRETDDSPAPEISRRTLLRASGGAFALPFAGTVRADDGRPTLRRCPDATVRPEHRSCESASMGGCADGHPETAAIRGEVTETLEDRYPTVGSLIDDGFLPYFDALSTDEDAYSHWLNPAYIGDDATLEPDRPESVLVDNRSWRPIGVMFIATRGGEPIDHPPTVYGHEVDESGDERGETGEYCAPWHAHVGLPGRFAWWYYQRVYEGERPPSLPCETPCMMHVWTVPHPESVYAHGPPPAEERDEPPAEPGFETDAEPGEDELGWEALPEEIEPEVKPADLRPSIGEWP